MATLPKLCSCEEWRQTASEYPGGASLVCAAKDTFQSEPGRVELVEAHAAIALQK